MNKKERAKLVQQVLEKYIPDPQIPLYHEDAYTLLIAVLLSASCTDERVNQTTPKLFKLARTPEKMAACSQEELEKLIQHLGLFRAKAKNIIALSKILCEKYNGQVPASLAALEELPGVGHKTASVVMAQAFGVPAFPVDTHIHRSSFRWGLSSGKSVEETEKDLKKLFPKASWTKLHLQIILFARKYCPAKKHHKSECPICSLLV
jgi:endonuclease III